MKKLLFLLNLLATFYLTSLAQNSKEKLVQKQVDSLKKRINTISGNSKVDCLNNIAYGLFWILDTDTSVLHEGWIYSTAAFNEAEKLGYKRGLGYAYEQLENCEAARADTNRSIGSHFAQAVTYAKKAIQIGEELHDNLMIGTSYRWLIWLEKWHGTGKISKIYVEKAIAAFKKITTQELTDIFWEPDSVNCRECIGNERILGNLYKDLCTVYVEENNPGAAKEQMDLAISCLEKTGDNQMMGDLYSSMSKFYFLRHDYKTSEENSKKSMHYYEMANDTLNQIKVCTQFCVVYQITGDFENGLAYSQKAISLVEKLEGNPPKERGRGEGNAFLWMSLIYTVAGDYETAFNVIQRGRDYYSSDDSVGMWFWSSQVGDLYRLKGNFDSAMFYLNHYAVASPNANNTGISSLGYLYVSLKQYDKALRTVIPDINYLRNVHIIMPPLENGLMVAANAYYGMKNYNKALEYAREAQKALEIMHGRVGMIDNCKLLSDIFIRIGKIDSAYFYLNQYSILKDSLLNRQFYFRLNNYKKQADEQRKISQINLLNKDNQLKQQKLKQEAIVRNALIIGLMLLMFLALFIFRTLDQRRKSEMQKQRFENEKKQAEFQQKTTELEMQALRAQMNPHFIFNCLSSINRFILKNEAIAASDYLTRFSRLIRLVLTNSQISMIPLSDEIEMLRLYLDMERLRFTDAFDYNITFNNSIQPEMIYIPPLLLQPFCENAIWHGLMHKKEKGCLNILFSMQLAVLSCTIEDDGIGRVKAAQMNTGSVKQKSVGLKITSERLALFNEGKKAETFVRTEDLMDESGNALGTRVILTIKNKDLVQAII
jgi:tetratricopeptide (TPR) repeat protein